MRKGSLDIFLYSSDLHQPAGLDSIGPRVYKAPDHATTGKTLPKTLDDYTRLPSIDDCKRPASADQIESLSDRREGVIPSLFNFNGTETNGRKVIRRGYYWRAGHRIQRLGCGEIRFSSNPILHDSNLIPRLKLRRFTDEHVRQTIDTYISGRTSLRRLPRCGPDNRTISLKTAYRWVVAAALNCKSPLEVSVELRPEWGRFLELDATPIRLRGELYSLMVALDMKTQDILHAKLLSDERDPRPIRAFFERNKGRTGLPTAYDYY